MTQVADLTADLQRHRQQKRTKKLDEYRALLRDIAERKIKRMPTAKLDELQTALGLTDEQIDADLKAMQQVVRWEMKLREQQDELPRLESRGGEIKVELEAVKSELEQLQRRQEELTSEQQRIRHRRTRETDLKRKLSRLERANPRLYDPPPAPAAPRPPVAEPSETPASAAEPEELGGDLPKPVPGSSRLVGFPPTILAECGGSEPSAPGPAQVEDYDPLA